MGWESLLSVVLFLLTLIIIFLLRAEDKKDRSLKNAKQISDQFHKEVAKASAQMKENAQQTSNEINAQITSVYQLIHSIDDKVSDLEGRSGDLEKLQNVMSNYRQVLVELSQTTSQAEQRITEVKAEGERLSALKDVIADFQSQIEEMKNSVMMTMRQSQEKLDASLASGKAQYEEFSSGIEAKMQTASESLANSMETVRKTQEDAKEAVSAHADQKMRETSESVSAFLESVNKAQNDAKAVVAEQNSLLHAVAEQNTSSLEESKSRYERMHTESVAQCDKDLAGFTVACSEKLELVFKQTVEQIDASFLTMVRTSQVFINELDSHLAATKEVCSALDAKNSMALSDLSRKLQEYSQQFANAQSASLSQENRKKQMEESIAQMRQETDSLHDELAHLKEQKASVIREMEARAAELERQAAVATASLPKEEEPPVIPEEKAEPEEEILPCPNAQEEIAGKEEGPQTENGEERIPRPQKEGTIVPDEPEETDMETSEEASVSVPASTVKTLDPSQPLPIQEFENAFVQEDKDTEPEEMPELSDLLEEGDQKEEKQEKAKVNYVPVGKEEVIKLDDDES